MIGLSPFGLWQGSQIPKWRLNTAVLINCLKQARTCAEIQYSISQHLAKGLTNFELITRISAENKSGRWDNNFIMTEVGNVQNLNKVIVCGPPVMSETFERCLHDMIKQKKISRH